MQIPIKHLDDSKLLLLLIIHINIDTVKHTPEVSIFYNISVGFKMLNPGKMWLTLLFGAGQVVFSGFIRALKKRTVAYSSKSCWILNEWKDAKALHRA